MVDQDKTDRWDEVLQEADKLAGVRRDPLGAPFSSGTGRRSKSETKPKFSLRGYTFPPLDVETENLCIGCQEGTSGQPKTKDVETMMVERLENIEEEAEDLQPELAFATHKVNTSVSELLEDLQGRSGSSVRTPVLLDIHAPDTAIWGQEISSEVPRAKASQTKMAELLGNIKEDTEELPSEFAQRTKKANISVAELLEDLQGRSGSSLRTAALKQQRVPDTAIREQEVSSGMPPTKPSKTLMTELLGYTNEDTEDLPSELVQPTKKANISVAELLEDLQGRSSSSFRTAALHQSALDITIREQEVSSELPPIKASETLMAEQLGNSKEDTEDVPSESARPTKKANISVAELLEDLQGRSRSSVQLHQHVRAKDHKPKLSTSGKKTLAILEERSHESDDPLEHAVDGISSDEEEVIQNYLTLVNKDVKQQTMTDLFQEIFDPANMEGTTLPVRSTGAGYCRRMQRIMQVEKDRHAEFLRQYNREAGSKGIAVKIMSRSLEGKLAVCRCLFQEMSNTRLWMKTELRGLLFSVRRYVTTLTFW